MFRGFSYWGDVMDTATNKVTAAEIFSRKKSREPGKDSTYAHSKPDMLNGKNECHPRKIAAITAYDYSFARLVDAAGVDVILVGDSLGMVMMGLPNTLGVTMDDMLHYTKSVARAKPRALLVADLPFLSYHGNMDKALSNAGRFLQEAGAEAVKLEGGVQVADTVRSLVEANIPVVGHVGLTPQAVHRFGGFKVQGRGRDAEQVFEDAVAIAEAGAFSIVLEGIPAKLARRITEDVHIPTIGIGAGPHCDGQILVLQDLLGLYEDITPKFAKVYAPLGGKIREAVSQYVDEVASGAFPTDVHSFS